MIPVAPAPEPDDFDKQVRQPGRRAIAELCGKRPPTRRTAGRPFQPIAKRESEIPGDKLPAYWAHSLDDLMSSYHEICAYACFRIHRVTGGRSVDHFVAKSRHWKHAYEWSNYRLCCSRLNARKQDVASVLDPFEIEAAWFQLELVGFQVHPNRRLPKTTQRKIQDTICQLHLNDFRRDREEDAELYWSGNVSLLVLKQESPFVAAELRRQGRLNAGDIW